jgi:hypothetical protein
MLTAAAAQVRRFYENATPRNAQGVRQGMTMEESLAVDMLEGLTVSAIRTAVEPYAGPITRPGPRGHPPEHFAWVAREYRRVTRENAKAPVRQLAEEMKVSEPTVRRWVQRARDLGYLRPSIPGRAGEATRRRKETDR